MSRAAARQGDQVTGTDVHVLLVPSPGGPVTTPTPLPFSGTITSGCVRDVLVNSRSIAVSRAVATNSPPHLAPPPATFQRPPTNRGTVQTGSLDGARRRFAGEPPQRPGPDLQRPG